MVGGLVGMGVGCVWCGLFVSRKARKGKITGTTEGTEHTEINHKAEHEGLEGYEGHERVVGKLPLDGLSY